MKALSNNEDICQLTMAQAIITYLKNQYIMIDGREERVCGGGFGIFGHGNVSCLGEALYQYREELPLYRGQNEQSMGFAAAAYAKYHLRRRFMFCTASAGPGTTNLLTSAALAHTNRLPMLLLCGDTFTTRLPDPVLQQVEHFNNPSLSVNDAFQSVTRYWDRITHPAQILQSLPAALATLLDPAETGPAFLALPQDVQGWAYDYPRSFFNKKIHHIRRLQADECEMTQAINILKGARKPLIIAGGGVQYANAVAELHEFVEQCQIPVVETIAGRANFLATHPLNCGPIGVTGSNSANNLARQADVILAVGTRLQDFTTGSWTVFGQDAKIVTLNVARHDAMKHQAIPVVGDAKYSLQKLKAFLQAYQAPDNWVSYARTEKKHWSLDVAKNVALARPTSSQTGASYAQVIGLVNDLCHPNDRIIAAAGGLPAEITANWQTKAIGTVDVEFGFSCMGYEIAGGWGARIAQTETDINTGQETIIFTGDGSYLLMNSDIYSSVLTGKKLIIILCDNGGYAVINKLQKNTGNMPYNNLIADCQLAGPPFSVDFEAHARAQGALAETVHTLTDFKDAFKRAQLAERSYLISIKVDPYDWTEEGHAWWEIGVSEVSDNEAVVKAGIAWSEGRQQQRKGV